MEIVLISIALKLSNEMKLKKTKDKIVIQWDRTTNPSCELIIWKVCLTQETTSARNSSYNKMYLGSNHFICYIISTNVNMIPDELQ